MYLENYNLLYVIENYIKHAEVNNCKFEVYIILTKVKRE
jgi:hypothetical protein